MRRVLLLQAALIILIGLTGSSAWASPNTIHYQGRLLYSNGSPVTQAVTITFTFYDAVSGGNRVGDGFSDADTVLPDADGYYAADIGDAPQLPVPAALFKADEVYLNVDVNGENLAPRKRLGDAGFASSSNTINGGEVGRMRFTAGGPVNEGDIVWLDAQGSIQPAKLPGVDSVVPAQVVNINIRSIAMGSNRILTANANQAYASIISGNQITHGAVLTYNSGTEDSLTSILALDESRALVVSEGALSQGIRSYIFHVLTISGNSVTAGPPVTINALAGAGLAVRATASRVVFFAKDPNSSLQYDVLNINGSTITPGTLRTHAEPYYLNLAGALEVVDNRVILFGGHMLWGSQMTLIDVSADELNFHPRRTLDPLFTSVSVMGGMLTTNSFLLRVYDSAINVRLTTLEVSDDVITTHAATVVPLLGQGFGELRIATAPPNRFVFINRDNAARFGDVQGNTITMGDPIAFASNAMGSESCPIMLSANQVFLTYAYFPPPPSTVIAEHRLLNNVSIVTPDFSRRIGVAEQTVGAGGECLVTIPGGITEQFNGLVPGSPYFVGESGPALTGTYLIGHALTPTKLQVWR